MGMEIHLVSINTPGHFRTESDLLPSTEHYYKGKSDLVKERTLFSSYDIEQGITEYCEEYGVDLAAMVTHHREGTSSMFINSLTEKLINHLKYPVLCLHD